MEYIIIFVTTSSKKEALEISHKLIADKLVACSNITSEVQSIFYWKEKVCNENEVLLMLKSKRKNFNTIVEEVKKIHSYETPEIIALPIIEGSKDYLQWIENETK